MPGRASDAMPELFALRDKVVKPLLDLLEDVLPGTPDVLVTQLDNHLRKASDCPDGVDRIVLPGWHGISAHRPASAGMPAQVPALILCCATVFPIVTSPPAWLGSRDRRPFEHLQQRGLVNDWDVELASALSFTPRILTDHNVCRLA
ncbi:MAG: hypothetical protein KatS3mg059_0569 [Thermomicrobiales bacterium]|nr:MAG: hypothetical protein KatS3mg059_0569 [Thermomicrobiales bacterium]